ncbi:hypothetical protein [Paraliobacillus zengyii]|nr:hypothetical protein [Paraliobacillus zengyii]
MFQGISELHQGLQITFNQQEAINKSVIEQSTKQNEKGEFQ